MKILKLITSCLLSFALVSNTHAQELLEDIPETKEEFVKSEKQVINSIDWLESHAVDVEPGRRKLVAATLTAWMINSPTVTITINSNVMPYSKKNSDLLLIFMGGWTRYCLQNSYSKDEFQCNLAAVKSMIKYFKGGNGLKKDKGMDKLVEIEEKGELDNWVKEQLAKK